MGMDLTHFRVLRLTLSKLPFEVMVTGEKKREFREPSKWMYSRMLNKDGTERQYDFVEFRHGYGKDKPYFICEFVHFDMPAREFIETYSNGLQVKVNLFTIMITLGKIVETGNIK